MPPKRALSAEARAEYASAHGSHTVNADGAAAVLPTDASAAAVLPASRLVKLPEFWSSSPDVWFVRAEGEFSLKSVVSEQMRHSYLVGALTEEHALMVQDALLSPDLVSPYSCLKEVLLETFRPSDFQRAQQLIEMRASPSERPSKLLNRMLSLLPRDVSTEKPGWLFEAHFLRRLPADIAAHLVGVDYASVRAMAKRADELFDARPSSSSLVVAAVGGGMAVPGGELHMGPSPSSAPSAASAADGECFAVSNRDKPFCWYHASFGEKATRCRSPCAWKPAGNAKGGRR